MDIITVASTHATFKRVIWTKEESKAVLCALSLLIMMHARLALFVPYATSQGLLILS